MAHTLLVGWWENDQAADKISLVGWNIEIKQLRCLYRCFLQSKFYMLEVLIDCFIDWIYGCELIWLLIYLNVKKLMTRQSEHRTDPK